MAINHIHFNAATQYGQLLRAALNTCESADEQLEDVRDMLIQMRDGDGSDPSHYANVVKRIGILDYSSTQGEPTLEQNTAAKALFDELDSAYSKTSGNGQVSDVRAARDQLYAKLRG